MLIKFLTVLQRKIYKIKQKMFFSSKVIFNQKFLLKILGTRKIHTIVHLASESRVDRSVRDL